MAKSDDYLAALPEAQVAAWYGRLAALIGKEKVRGNEPLAAIFLLYPIFQLSTMETDSPLAPLSSRRGSARPLAVGRLRALRALCATA